MDKTNLLLMPVLIWDTNNFILPRIFSYQLNLFTRFSNLLYFNRKNTKTKPATKRRETKRILLRCCRYINADPQRAMPTMTRVSNEYSTSVIAVISTPFFLKNSPRVVSPNFPGVARATKKLAPVNRKESFRDILSSNTRLKSRLNLNERKKSCSIMSKDKKA